MLVPTTTFTASAEVVAYFKAKPVLVDVDAETLSIDPADAERRINAADTRNYPRTLFRQAM